MTRFQLVRHIAWPGVASTDGLVDDRDPLEAARAWPAMFSQFDALYLAAIDSGGALSCMVVDELEGAWRLVDLEKVPPEVSHLFGSWGYKVLCRQSKWDADPDALEQELRDIVGRWERKRGRPTPRSRCAAPSGQEDQGAPTLGDHAHDGG